MQDQLLAATIQDKFHELINAHTSLQWIEDQPLYSLMSQMNHSLIQD